MTRNLLLVIDRLAVLDAAFTRWYDHDCTESKPDHDCLGCDDLTSEYEAFSLDVRALAKEQAV